MMKSFFGLGLLCLIVIAGGLYYFGYIPNGKRVEDPQVLAIQKRGTLTIGTDATYPPMESVDAKGNVVGFEIDLMREVAKGMGVTLTIQTLAFDTLFDAVQTGKIDLAISAMTITPERAQKVLFSNPYFNAGQAIIVSKTNATVTDADGLRGKTIAVQTGTTSQKEAQKLTDAKHVVVYESSYDRVVKQLQDGSVDAIIMDFPAAVDLVEHNPGTKVVGPPFTSEFYGIAARKENNGLIEHVNSILGELKTNGVLAALNQKWLHE